MKPRPKEHRSPALEGFSLRINEGPRRQRRKPFTLTFLGDGVASVDGVGLFATGTTAEVDAATAERYRDDPAWRVAETPRARR